MFSNSGVTLQNIIVVHEILPRLNLNDLLILMCVNKDLAVLVATNFTLIAEKMNKLSKSTFYKDIKLYLAENPSGSPINCTKNIKIILKSQQRKKRIEKYMDAANKYIRRVLPENDPSFNILRKIDEENLISLDRIPPLNYSTKKIGSQFFNYFALKSGRGLLALHDELITLNEITPEIDLTTLLNNECEELYFNKRQKKPNDDKEVVESPHKKRKN